MTPLEKALAARLPRTNPRKTYDLGDVELAIAWAKGQVSCSQAQAGFDKRNTAATYLGLAMALRFAVAHGLLVEPNANP